MKSFIEKYRVNARLAAEVCVSGVLAFIIVSIVFSATSPAPLSLTYMMTLA